MHCHTPIREVNGRWKHTGTSPMRSDGSGGFVELAGGPSGHDAEPWMGELRAQCARDAQRSNQTESYVRYLDDASVGKHAYYTELDQPERAEEMLTRSWGQSLVGNDGD